jgi:hypothetical protein
MKKSETNVSFESNRTFKSKVLSLIIETLNTTACIVLLFVILNVVLEYCGVESDIFAIEGAWDILHTLIVVFVLHLIMSKSTLTRVDIQSEKLVLQNPSTFSIPIKTNILAIKRIELHPNRRWEFNVNIICSNGRKLSTSVKDIEKFVQLLKEQTPSFEVEYKE